MVLIFHKYKSDGNSYPTTLFVIGEDFIIIFEVHYALGENDII